ncbi:MAG: DUF1826 domain-containing protein [Pseudoruegeria sp.]
MTFACATLKTKMAGVVIVDQPEHLSAFMQPDCAAAIWRRRSTADFQKWVSALSPSQLPQGRVIVQPNAVRSIVTELCEIADTPACTHRDQLIDDITVLSEIFTDLMKSPYLRLRLQAVTNNACRKFHVDAIAARLVCTYRGTGTQYGVSTNGRNPEQVFSTPTCAPILLRGTHWPETPSSGLLHRSPPIEGTGQTRLVLVLDQMFDHENTR